MTNVFSLLSREDGRIEVGDFDGVVIFLHGVGVGRLRFHHQSHSSSRLRAHPHGEVFSETLRRLLGLLHFRLFLFSLSFPFALGVSHILFSPISLPLTHFTLSFSERTILFAFHLRYLDLFSSSPFPPHS